MFVGTKKETSCLYHTHRTQHTAPSHESAQKGAFMNIAELIPAGKQNAIKRADLLNRCRAHGLRTTDRGMRMLIESARKETVIINLSNGDGYYRPTADDKDELKRYIHQEDQRAKSASINHHMAKALLEDINAGRIY